MTSSPERTLVLVGPMAAGKSSIGRSAARMLGVPFRDSDRRIAAAHGPIPDIFAEHGEEHFRAVERETVATLLGMPGVLSLGGGGVIDPRTRERLTAHPVVFLTVSPEAVAARLASGGRPMLVGDEDPLEGWQRIFDERRAWYEEVADVTFDTSHGPMRRVAERVAEWARGRMP